MMTRSTGVNIAVFKSAMNVLTVVQQSSLLILQSLCIDTFFYVFASVFLEQSLGALLEFSSANSQFPKLFWSNTIRYYTFYAKF